LFELASITGGNAMISFRMASKAMLEFRLAQAEEHVTMGSQRIAEQRQRIENMQRDGLDTGLAKQLLAQFEETLSIHIADREKLLDALMLP
jgi:hypothetical protein